jgi:hypothetical protein
MLAPLCACVADGACGRAVYGIHTQDLHDISDRSLVVVREGWSAHGELAIDDVLHAHDRRRALMHRHQQRHHVSCAHTIAPRTQPRHARSKTQVQHKTGATSRQTAPSRQAPLATPLATPLPPHCHRLLICSVRVAGAPRARTGLERGGKRRQAGRDGESSITNAWRDGTSISKPKHI